MDNKYPFIDVRKDYFYQKYGHEWAESRDNDFDSYSYSVYEVDGYTFPIYKREIVSANVLEVVAGTNGYHDGDSGHGCRTFIRIKDVDSTDIKVKVLERYGDTEGVEIVLGGDTELNTIIKAFRYIADVLEIQGKNLAEYYNK